MKKELTPEQTIAAEKRAAVKQAKQEAANKMHIENRLAGDLRDLMEGITLGKITEPTYLFNVGDRVIHGNIEESVVVEVIEGGKIYKLWEKTKENNYGKSVYSERFLYVGWIDLLPYVENNTVHSVCPKTKIERLHFLNQDVGSLLNMFYHPGVDMDVDYQRGLVWDDEQKHMLIDSIYNDVPFGCFIFNRRSYSYDGKLYEIIDGKQRLSTIISFYESRFAYKGVLYKDMLPTDRYVFKGAGVLVATAQELTEYQKMEIFLRYNSTGKPQSPEHLEKVKKLLEREMK